MRSAPLTRRGTTEHSERMKRERKASWARIKDGQGYIYLARDERADCIKLGFSLNPEWRCFELRIALLAKIEGTHRQELALHKALGGGGRHGEYYDRSILSHPAIPQALRMEAA